jgi:putative ABC transport system permease protein
MFDLEQWREVLDSLWRHKLRSGLTSLSVFWGMLMLVLLLGSGNGLQRGVTAQFEDDAVNSIWIYPGTTSMPYRGLSAGRNVQFTNTDYDRIRANEPAVDRISGRYYLFGEYSVSRGDISSSYYVRCVHPDHQYIENTKVTEGRFLNESDQLDTRKVCVIGVDVLDGLYEEGESALGTYIKIKGVLYMVVGVFNDSGGRNENKQIYLPVKTAQQVDNGKSHLNQLMFTLKSDDVGESIKMEEKIRTSFADAHRFNPADDQAIYINNSLEEFQRFLGLFSGIQGFIWIIGILTLIAGIIGISNIMLISVHERTKEIGVRKALGATNSSIVSMIMQEAIMVTSMAGYLGMMLGIGILWAVSSFVLPTEPSPDTMFLNPGVTPGVVISSLLILVISGGLSGLIPAIRAVRIAPAVAMKS